MVGLQLMCHRVTTRLEQEAKNQKDPTKVDAAPNKYVRRTYPYVRTSYMSYVYLVNKAKELLNLIAAAAAGSREIRSEYQRRVKYLERRKKIEIWQSPLF